MSSIKEMNEWDILTRKPIIVNKGKLIGYGSQETC